MDKDKTASFPLGFAWIEVREFPSPFRVHWEMVAPNPSGGVFAIFSGESQVTEEMDYDETMHWLDHAGMFVDFFSESGKKLDIPPKLDKPTPAFGNDTDGYMDPR